MGFDDEGTPVCSAEGINHQDAPNTEDPRVSASVGRFYEGGAVLVTGGTGFVGKALLEKLLRTCDGVRTVLVLLRPKRGLTVEQRHKQLVDDEVFDQIRARWPERLNKLTAVTGDVSAPHLGIEQHERHLLTAVTHIFHSAATVRFNDSLKTTVSHNVQSTATLCEMAKNMKNLKAFVHVSTAYSNAPQHHIEERVYPPPYDPEVILSCVKNLPEDTVEAITETLVGQHPNNYTFSKALAESIVYSHKDLPVCIVRPSIVTAAIQDPIPGWVDNLAGPTGILMAQYCGVHRPAFSSSKVVADLIPVDLVINACILAAWRQGTDSPGHCPVYNVTSGSINPINWAEFFNNSLKWCRLNPTKHVVWYPKLAISDSRTLSWLWESVTMKVSVQAWDLVMKMRGRKPEMVNMLRRARAALAASEFFTSKQWSFQVSGLRSLRAAAAAAPDGGLFAVWPAGFCWEEYLGVYMTGVRRFILKDGAESLPEARGKLSRLYWLEKSLEAAVCAGLILFFLIASGNLSKLCQGILSFA